MFISIYEYLLTYMNIGIYRATRSLLLLLSVMTHINTLWLVHCSLATLNPPPLSSRICTIGESGLWMLLHTTRPSAELFRNQAQWPPALWSPKTSWNTRGFILCLISVALMQQSLPCVYKAISFVVLFVLWRIGESQNQRLEYGDTSFCASIFFYIHLLQWEELQFFSSEDLQLINECKR